MITYKKLCKQKCVEVYSCQENNANLSKSIKDQATYYPQWNKSAACNFQNGESKRLAHEQAYLWLKGQYENHFNRTVVDGFFWMVLDKGLLNKTSGDVIILHVPIDQLLFFSYIKWEGVLRGEYWCDQDSIWRMSPKLSLEKTKQSWEVIFKIDDNDFVSDLQAVTDRVEPSWIKEVIKDFS